MNFKRATVLYMCTGSFAFPSVPEEFWSWAAKGFFMPAWCMGSAQGWLRRECSICLCHCCGAGSAELKEELAHGFPFLSSHVSTSRQCGEAVRPREHQQALNRHMAAAFLPHQKEMCVFPFQWLESTMWPRQSICISVCFEQSWQSCCFFKFQNPLTSKSHFGNEFALAWQRSPINSCHRWLW